MVAFVFFKYPLSLNGSTFTEKNFVFGHRLEVLLGDLIKGYAKVLQVLSTEAPVMLFNALCYISSKHHIWKTEKL